VGEAMFCEVIIDIKHDNVNRFFDYIIPAHMVSFLMRGMRVIVPFGAQNRLGFVMKIKSKSTRATKEISEILDVIPALSNTSFFLMDHLELHTTAPYAQIIETVLPQELLVNYEKDVKIIDETLIPEDLKPFFNQKGIWHLKPKDQIYQKQIINLLHKKAIEVESIIKAKAKEKTIKTYQFNQHHQYAKIEKYEPYVQTLEDKTTYTQKSLAALGLTTSMIKTLTKHDVFIEIDTQVDRELQHVFDYHDKKVILTPEQQKAFSTVVNAFNKPQTLLLKGVTGSGKTEIYLNLIESVLEKNQTVMILVPEIMLIGMMAQRLKSRFDDVIIYHSALSKGERYDQIQKIYQNKAQIILGTRSAIFLPIEKLGLIIIDEEHDPSYEQKDNVYYHARDLAQVLSVYHQAPVLLGSATPSINSMYYALQKTYQLIELNERPLQQKMPKITLIDMKTELKNGHTSMFSKKLIDGISKRLEKKEQVLILYNRKGYAPFVLCRTCGDVPKCPHCDISLTYYQDKQILKCHYCGHEKPYQNTCDVCHKDTVKSIGAGIELVESALKKTFPTAKVMRMDANVTQKKGSHEQIWYDFLDEKADIMVGTQMIAKGLDFPKVTLVGILMADLLLKVPSYMASEQAYMLLTQMSGRSGRSMMGETIIQGYDLEHYAITSVSKGYETFYNKALSNRKLGSYEPFKQVSQLLVEGESYLQTYQKAFMLKKLCDEHNIMNLGPAPALIKKIKNRYRFNVTLKYDHLDIKEVKSWIDTYQTEHISIKFVKSLDV
jgi:primosomal protein N' (replication factor Y) (superfamily II helicase)